MLAGGKDRLKVALDIIYTLGRFGRQLWALPQMMARMLLNSWAMPEASVPTACIF